MCEDFIDSFTPKTSKFPHLNNTIYIHLQPIEIFCY